MNLHAGIGSTGWFRSDDALDIFIELLEGALWIYRNFLALAGYSAEVEGQHLNENYIF